MTLMHEKTGKEKGRKEEEKREQIEQTSFTERKRKRSRSWQARHVQGARNLIRESIWQYKGVKKKCPSSVLYTSWVDIFGQFEGVRIGQIYVGRRDGQDQATGLRNEC